MYNNVPKIFPIPEKKKFSVNIMESFEDPSREKKRKKKKRIDCFIHVF